MGGAVGPPCFSRSSLPRVRRLSFCIGGDTLLGAWSIFQACCLLNQGSFRQCPLGLAMARVSWVPLPSARARKMALPGRSGDVGNCPVHPHVHLLKALWHPPPSPPRGPPASPYPAPASAACRPLAGAGRNCAQSATRQSLIHSYSVGSVFCRASALAPVAVYPASRTARPGASKTLSRSNPIEIMLPCGTPWPVEVSPSWCYRRAPYPR
jgi:hypothetical protein